MAAFNSNYCTVLPLLERTLDGVPSLLSIATGAMYGIKQQIIELIALGTGPSFEWVPPQQGHFPDTLVHVVPHGPYLVRGAVDVYDAAGQRRVSDGVCMLCRCGGSRTKPFCDGTHARIGFDGCETADVEPMSSRRRAYPTSDGAVVYDDRTRCAHFGQCTDRIPEAFGRDRESGHDDFVDPTAAPSPELGAVVAGCPSGALTFSPDGSEWPKERHEGGSIHPIVDDPYRVRGGVPVVGADGRRYEVRERQTLCRCGNSRNKPYCDGSHWYAGFRDPLPAELVDADPLPWTVNDAAELGRERYAATGSL